MNRGVSSEGGPRKISCVRNSFVASLDLLNSILVIHLLPIMPRPS
jgi:hypothetical protein